MNALNSRLASPSFAPVRQDRHLRALDGLRGVAILMVLLGHFYQRALIRDSYLLSAMVGRLAGAGQYGVELFFVLSGFLITGILLDSSSQAGSLRNFYMRRILRIFPLYYGSLILTLLVLPNFVALDDGARQISRHQVWLWTYLANSYGPYVIHGILRPVLERVLAVDRLPGGPEMGVVYMIAYFVPAISVSYGLAYASYHLFEKRFLALKRHWSYANSE